MRAWEPGLLYSSRGLETLQAALELIECMRACEADTKRHLRETRP